MLNCAEYAQIQNTHTHTHTHTRARARARTKPPKTAWVQTIMLKHPTKKTGIKKRKNAPIQLPDQGNKSKTLKDTQEKAKKTTVHVLRH